MRLAFSWLTVLPLHVAEVDGRAARRAIAAAPVVGVALGLVVAGLLWTAHLVGLPRCWRVSSRSRCWRWPRAACTSTGSPTPRTAWAATARPSAR
ncbi:adenosylcobinamide-GDP ribazoletransferase [Actinokineospora soli]|uniref:Adenosylcobinamide-GDP ribazoletransferase n=1 Tax=Actinokineospora soli TaxID=1048753 RepID=A0ABW2TJ71_9PSEU